MQTHLDCYACFFRQALRATRMVTDDDFLQKKVLDEVAKEVQNFPLSASPPEMAVFIYQTINRVCGARDPYYQVKQEYNQKMLTLLPKLRDQAVNAPDPLKAAVKFAIAGNAIDFGSSTDFDVDFVLEHCQETSRGLLAYEEFRQAVDRAEHILYLGDNAGEIVLDKLLIEVMAKPTCFVVRGAPIINDVTLDDARAVGMADVAEVISNGDCAPGTILSRCSDDFRRRFEQAPVIISKGQGNFETLSGTSKPVFFLLRVKCHVVAERLNLSRGSAMLLQSPV